MQVIGCCRSGGVSVFLPLQHLPSLLRLDAAGICSPGLPHWPFKWQFSHLAIYLPGQPSALSLSPSMVYPQSLGYELDTPPPPQHKPGIAALLAHITKAHREQGVWREERGVQTSVPTNSSSLGGPERDGLCVLLSPGPCVCTRECTPGRSGQVLWTSLCPYPRWVGPQELYCGTQTLRWAWARKVHSPPVLFTFPFGGHLYYTRQFVNV